MEPITQFQRYETSYRLLSTELNSIKDEFNELKNEFTDVVEENKRLRRDLKDALQNQLSPLEKDNTNKNFNDVDRNVIQNLEKQNELLRNERENAIQMWQKSVLIISQLEQDLKNLQFQTAPQTMSFDLELKKRQEEFARIQATQIKEISILRAELNQKEEDIMQSKLKQNELKLQIENLSSQINQKDLERRNLIKKEYGYDNALLSLQNDINDLETKILSLNKDNQYLRDNIQESNNRINQLNKQYAEIERYNSEIKSKYDENLMELNHFKEKYQQIEMKDLNQKEEHERLHQVIGELMDEATNKTKNEVESLRKLYNANIEKLIEECSSLETDRNTIAAQLEKALRSKRSLEQEIEKLTIENMRNSSKENSTYEEIYRRLCAIEREKDQALMRLETKENELKKYQSMYENDKEKNHKIIADFTEKSYKTSREFEKLSDEHGKLLNEFDELKNKLNSVETEKDNLQKKLTKQIQFHESEMQVKNSEYMNKIKCLEDSNSKAMFDLRQLLNMQQRMSNKWKEECHSITQQSEVKFLEMKKNFENIRLHNERLLHELQDAKRKEIENERNIGAYLSKIKNLEIRCKDAEHQATEATKRIAKQLAREKMIEYEKHLLESDLERNKFKDTFSKGRIFSGNINELPERQNQKIDKNDSFSDN